MFRKRLGLGPLLLVVAILSGAFPFVDAGYAKEAENRRPHGLLTIQGIGVKWGVPVFGTPARLRYAFLTAPVRRPAARNCKAMTPLPERLGTAGIARTAVESEVEAAFGVWQDAANITFERVEDSALADVVIGAQARPRRIAFADVIFDPPSSSDLAPLREAAFCLNPLADWETGFDGNDRTYDVRYVAIHEIGHVIGLDHPKVEVRSVMNFKYRETGRTLRPFDFANARVLYGPRRVPTVPGVVSGTAAGRY